MSIRSALALTCLAAAITLSACSSDPEESNGEATITSITPMDRTVAPVAPQDIVRAFPAVGDAQGIQPKGGPDIKCADGMTTVTLDFLRGIEYNGTNIDFQQYTYDQDANPTTPEKQISVTVEITGKPFEATSAIVNLDDYSLDVFGNPKNDPVPDQVVNMTDEMRQNGFEMNTLDFRGDRIDAFITGIDFCVEPAR